MQKPEYQATFNTVYTALLQQGVASKMPLSDDSDDERSICAYRGENGNKCAVGHLIPDHRYTPDLEKQTVDRSDGSLKVLLEELFPNADESFFLFLRELQNAHDLDLDDWGVQAWQTKMALIATQYQLEIPNV